MRIRTHALYNGHGRGSKLFRWCLFVFDICTIAYFLATAFGPFTEVIVAVDLLIGIVLLADFLARMFAARSIGKYLLSPVTWADIIVLMSLLAPLLVGPNFAFLRVLRALRLLRSFHVAEQMTIITDYLPINPRVVVAATNLVAFIFVVTSLVWVLEHERNPDLSNYLDALYFTITTLTTTGFGDITLTDRLGRILTVFIMVFGVGFFLNLLRAIYQPSKVEAPCPECGLRLHEHDASHCKHCGHVVYIATEGDAA